MNSGSKTILAATLVPGIYTASAFGNTVEAGETGTLYPVVLDGLRDINRVTVKFFNRPAAGGLATAAVILEEPMAAR